MEEAEGCPLLVALFLDQRLELALHRFESVVDYLAQRFVHLVHGLFFVRDQLVAGWDGNIDPHPEGITGMLGVVGMLDDHVAAADVIAETIEARGFAANEFLELVRFLDPPIRDSNG